MRYLDLFHKRIFLNQVINQQQGEYALLNMTTKYWEDKISFFFLADAKNSVTMFVGHHITEIMTAKSIKTLKSYFLML